jgi:hypothetical protein
MKRSEMITIMTNAWRDYVHNLKSPDQAGVRNGMTHVLTVIEDAGMIPRPIFQYEDGFSNDKADEMYGVFGWEDEE